MIARNILIVIGSLFILFNAMAYLGGGPNPAPEDLADESKTAYTVGFNSFFIIGAIFLLIAWFLHKRAIKKRNQQAVDSFLSFDQKQKDQLKP